MKFGDIFPLLLVLLILYYAAMIAMDLYKARLEKEAEKEKNTEEDIDISDEAAAFQPIRIRRDEPKKLTPPASDETKSGENPNGLKPKPDETSESKPKDDENSSEKPKNTESEEVKDKPVETPKSKVDPFDPEAYKIPDEVLAEHRKERPESTETKAPQSKSQSAPESPAPTPRKKALRGPVMTNGIPADDLVAMVEDQTNGVPSDLQNFAYKCESA